MNRGFYKISFDQFKNDISDNENLYNDYLLPERKTTNSAGYDFLAIKDFIIQPGEIVKIPTGVKVCLLPDEVLFLVVRSSMGFKYNVRLCNQVGVIDADYFDNNGNEGHIFVALQNEGEKEFRVNKGDAFVQGIILKYNTFNDKVDKKRKSGIGSTNKEEE